MSTKNNNTGIDNTGYWNSGVTTFDISTGYYVKRHNGKKTTLHRIIIGAKAGEIVDHIDRDKTNNNPSNLRIVTKSQNNRNKHSQGYTITRSGKYEVKTTYENKTYYVGLYDNQKDAELAFGAVTKFIFDITGLKSELLKEQAKKV